MTERPSSLQCARSLLLRAAVLVIVFLGLHAAGLRNATTVLSGSVPANGMSPALAATGGACYLLSWIGLTVFAPVFVLAAGWLWLLPRGFHRPVG